MVDVIVSYQTEAKIRAEEFQVWDFRLDGQGGCVATCTDGNDSPPLVKQDIPYTDLTFDVKFFLQLGSIDMETPAWVIMLPGEY
jgi:hypothetical protein